MPPTPLTHNCVTKFRGTGCLMAHPPPPPPPLSISKAYLREKNPHSLYNSIHLLCNAYNWSKQCWRATKFDVEIKLTATSGVKTPQSNYNGCRPCVENKIVF